MYEWLIDTWNAELTTTVISIVVYALVYIVGNKITRFIFNKISSKLGKKAIHWAFLRRAIQCVLIFIAVFGIASTIPILDKFVATIVTSSAVIIAAVGLASQESLSNVISGIFISIFKPFAIGDRVKIISNGTVGIIEDINLRHTVIRTSENNRIIVPNTTINKEIIENSNYRDICICNFLDVKIDYDSDIGKAKSIIKFLILNHLSIIDTRTEKEISNNTDNIDVMVRDISNGCVELRVGVWTSDIGSSFKTCSELRESILKEFKKSNIKLYIQSKNKVHLSDEIKFKN